MFILEQADITFFGRYFLKSAQKALIKNDKTDFIKSKNFYIKI